MSEPQNVSDLDDSREAPDIEELKGIAGRTIGEADEILKSVRAIGTLTQMVARCCADESPNRTTGRDQAMEETAVALDFLAERLLDLYHESHRTTDRAERRFRKVA